MKWNLMGFWRKFTLSDVVWGVVLFVFVFGFLLPSIPMFREPGQRVLCLGHLKQIGLAFNLFQADHNEQFPTNVTDLIKYIGGDGNAEMITCPTRNRSLSGKPPKLISDFHTMPQFVGYEYLSATSTVPGKAVGATILPVMCDKAGNHDSDGINMLFADGHAEWWSGTIEDYARSNSLTITINTNWVK